MSFKSTWPFSNNPFLSSTRKSFSRALIIGTFTDAALFANISDPMFLALYNTYHPIFTAYETAYGKWGSSLGIKVGSTLGLSDLMKELVVRARKWDVAIQNVFAHDTGEYKSLMPHGRTPFNRGSHLSRIEMVSVLDLNLTGKPALAALKTEVNSFHTTLNDALSNKQGKSSASNLNSKLLEINRKELCKALFVVLGSLIAHFPESPRSIESYFDLVMLRQHRQTDFTGHLAAMKTHIIARRTLKQTNTLTLKNKGNTTLRFYLAQNKQGMMGDVFIELAPHSMLKDVAPSSLGDSASMHFYCVRNLNEHEVGEWEMVVG